MNSDVEEPSAVIAALRARGEALLRAEQEARERTRLLELANAELRAAYDAARAAALSMSELLAGVGRELRTPMTAILGFADRLLDPALPDEERAAHLGTIRNNGGRLLAILDDVLDLSRLDAGRMPIERTNMSPTGIVREVTAALRARAREKGLSLRVTPLGAVPDAIECDPTRLRQILSNLIANAIQFTPSGGIEIQIALEPFAADEPRRVAFTVIDTGIGIAAERLPLLFRPFGRIDDSTRRPLGGAGLGLPISQRLARLLGGDLRVESRPGTGSTFTATVTVGNAVRTAPAAPAGQARHAEARATTANPPSALPSPRLVRLGEGSPVVRRPDQPFRAGDDEPPEGAQD